jgi:hypothetical protein
VARNEGSITTAHDAERIHAVRRSSNGGFAVRRARHYEAALVHICQSPGAFMTITISSAFDAGNIRVVEERGDTIDLEIVKDHMSDFHQWFHFRLAGAGGREVTLRIVNCGSSAYPDGWPDYKACVSLDREDWTRIAGTSFADGVLTIKFVPETDLVWVAYFALLHGTAPDWYRPSPPFRRRISKPRQEPRRPGYRLPDVRRSDLTMWLYARQHPGETMAEWWMEARWKS